MIASSLMVSFNCSGCGDVITKGKIKAHAQRCHIGSLDCLDCRGTFAYPSAELDAHTSCVSEAQKVQGKLFKAAKKPGAPRKQPAATPAAEDEGASPSKRAKPASPTPEAPLVVAEPVRGSLRSVWVPLLSHPTAHEAHCAPTHRRVVGPAQGSGSRGHAREARRTGGWGAG